MSTKGVEMNNTVALVLIGMLFVVSGSPCAGYAETSVKEQVVYDKFFQAIGAEQQYNEMIAILQNQYKQVVSLSLQSHLDMLRNATPEKKEAIAQVISESTARTLKRLTDELAKEMPFEELVRNIYIPIYKKHYSLEEIKEITAFFEGPTGKKFVATSPQLMQQASTQLNEQYGAKIQQVSKVISEEEVAKIKADLDRLEKE